MCSLFSPSRSWVKSAFTLSVGLLPGTALAHGFGDYRVYTFVITLLLIVVPFHAVYATILLRKEKFAVKRLLRISLALSTVSIVAWLFLFKIVMDSHSGDSELFVLLGVAFISIGIFAILPVRQYERHVYGERSKTRRIAP